MLQIIFIKQATAYEIIIDNNIKNIFFNKPYKNQTFTDEKDSLICDPNSPEYNNTSQGNNLREGNPKENNKKLPRKKSKIKQLRQNSTKKPPTNSKSKLKKTLQNHDDWEIYLIPKDSFYLEKDDLENNSGMTKKDFLNSLEDDWEMYFIPKNGFYGEIDDIENNSEMTKEDVIKLRDAKTKEAIAETIINYGESSDISQKVPKEFFYKPKNENESTIILLRLGRFIILDETLPAYVTEDGLFIPLAQFAKDVEFPINVNEGLTGASGWFLDKLRLFTLDFKNKILLVGGKRFTPTPDNIRIIDEDIYFKMELLSKIFPVKLAYDDHDQAVVMESLEQLPIEGSLDREKVWEDLAQAKDLEYKLAKEKLGVKSEKTPYKMATIPVGDIKYSHGFINAKDTGNVSNKQINTMLAGDLLKLNYQLYTNMTNSNISSVRLTFNRTDNEGKLLGPLKANEFMIGDTFAPQDSLVSRGQFGSGGSVSNFPDDYISQFDKIVIRGNAIANWDAELYRNNSLLNFQKVPETGIYEFQGVELLAGLNIIKVVLYGPFGQRREEVKKYFIDDSNLRKNKFYYRFAVNKNNQSLINLGQDDSKKQDPNYGLNRFYNQIAYGLSATTSISMNYQNAIINNGGNNHNYLSSSLRTSIFGIYTNLNIARDLDYKASANEITMQTNISDYTFTLKRSSFDKYFASEQHQLFLNPMLEENSLRINGAIPIPFSKKMVNSSLKLIKQDFESKQSRYDIENDLAFNVGGKLNISQNIQFAEDERLAGSQRISMNGKTGLNIRATNLMSFRNTLSYIIKQKKELSANIATADYKLKNGLGLTIGHNYRFASQNSKPGSSYSLSIGKIIKNTVFSMSCNYDDSTKNYGANINLSSSIGYDPKNKHTILSDSPLSNIGIVSARIFIDKNTNNIFDDGDEPLEGIGIETEGSATNAKSNKNGVVISNRVSPNRSVKIKVKIEDLKDPYLVPKKTAVNLITHPGVISYLDFPIYPSGEVSGYAMILDKVEGLVPASNVRLEIIDEDNSVIKQTESGYDGYYIFDMIPYGKYKIKVSQEQMERLGLEASDGYKIEINNDNQELKFDFNLKYDESRQPTNPQQNNDKIDEDKTSKIEDDLNQDSGNQDSN